MAFCRGGASKFGTFDRDGTAGGASSTAPNEMISTILNTSFLTFSGSDVGRGFPVNLRLHKYIARANSGNKSCPDFVVSDSIHMFERSLPASLERSRRSLALSPSSAVLFPTADLNNCSNFA